MNQLSYSHMEHVSDGRYMDLTKPTESFNYYIITFIDWLSDDQRRHLF